MNNLSINNNNKKLIDNIKYFIKILFVFVFLIVLLFLFQDVSGIFKILDGCESLFNKNISNFSSLEKIHCSLIKSIEININQLK
jgi:hypothetical protein